MTAFTSKLAVHKPGGGGGGGGGEGGGGRRRRDFHMKGTGMLVVSLRGVNFGFWSRLGCFRQNVTSFSRQGLVKGCTPKKKRKRKNFDSLYLVF